MAPNEPVQGQIATRLEWPTRLQVQYSIQASKAWSSTIRHDGTLRPSTSLVQRLLHRQTSSSVCETNPLRTGRLLHASFSFIATLGRMMRRVSKGWMEELVFRSVPKIAPSIAVVSSMENSTIEEYLPTRVDCNNDFHEDCY